jgi:hypothetical protein
VDQNNADGNYGSSFLMRAGAYSGAANRALIQFDLTAIPTGTSISQASLRVYYQVCAVLGTTTTLTAYRVDESWEELTATWNSQPAYAEAYGSAAFTSCASGWRSFDVTNLVQGWVNDDYPNYGVLLRSVEGSNNRWAGLCTREGTGELGCYDYLRPHLTITYGTH